jgi:3'(2'), 5'-bisphosphate nucleotidase
MPRIGIISIPVSGSLYLADVHQGAWESRDGRRRRIQVASPPAPERSVRIVKSRSHASPNLEAILDLFSSYDVLKRGSALKFCAIATGEADFYPRFGPTWEWDTAAGQAIVTAAGGAVVDLAGRPFVYNKPSLLNGPFLVASSMEWLKRQGVLDRTAGLSFD